MRPRRWRPIAVFLAFFLVLVGFAPALAQTGQEQARQVHGINPADMDLAADPRADFYRFANGGWLDRTTIPADEGSYGVFRELDDETTQLLLDLLGRLAEGGGPQGGTDEWKAIRLFEQGTDLATRNAQGLEPVRPILDEIDAIADLSGLHLFLEGAAFRGLGGIVPMYGSPDLQDSSINVANVGGPFLGLRTRDYYLEDDEGNAEVRDEYRATLAEFLTYLDYDPARAEAAAQAVYDLERRLAEPTLTREEQQNISLYYNPTSIDELAVEYPLMDWRRYLEALGLSDVTQVNVDEARYLDALDGIVRATPIDVLKDYLKLEVFWTFRNNLSEEIAATSFDFRGRVLGGLEEMPPVEELALDQVNAFLGEAVGKIYVAETFPPEAKEQITDLVDELIVAFGERLAANPWMTPETKATALDKLAKMGVKVGYPDRWRSYGAVTIEGSYAASVLSAANAEARRNFEKVGKPVDPSEWFIPPQVVNAFYSPQNNEIVFPAAILQPPFFDYRADPASNFGAIGFVIGHEITHGFDLQGSQFDADGDLVNWWTPEDTERFQALNDRVVAQYGAIEVLPGLFIDGQITVTENVADLGGVQVAYQALDRYLATRGQPLPPPPVLDGAASAEATTARFGQQQRFFIAAATVWREKTRDEALESLVRTDPHAPAEVRATQPIRNMDAFFEVFDIQPGDPMYLPPEERVVIW